MAKQDSIEVLGTITEALGNSMFRVELDGPGTIILAQLSGRMRKFSIRVLPGDRVKLELSPYDLTRGRISERLKPFPTQKDPVFESKKKEEKNNKIASGPRMFHSSALIKNKKLMKTKQVMMMAVLSLFSVITRPATSKVKPSGHKVTATKYHPVKSQCSGNPLITADGSKINLGKLKAGKLRWIAVSRDLLRHYDYGDTVLVISENKNISGKWIIHDTMNSRFRQKIDFLMHPSSSHVIPRKVTIFPA